MIFSTHEDELMAQVGNLSGKGLVHVNVWRLSRTVERKRERSELK